MGESAVQGYWTADGMERGKMGLREQTIKNCHLWKEGGPIVKEIRENLEPRAE
jgi:hypothetical protein